MDPNSGRRRSEVPECKICFTSDNLMGVPVCECRGSVGSICRNCLFTILGNSIEGGQQRHICADCHRPYRNYSLDYRQSDISYNEYMNETDGLSYGRIGATFSCEAIIIIIFNLIYWLLPIPANQQSFLTIVYMVIMGIFIIVNIAFGRDIYRDVVRYRNRPATELAGVIPVPPHHESVIQIEEEPKVPAIDQFEKVDDIPHMDEQYLVPVFEAPHRLPSIQKENVGFDIELQDMGPIIPPPFFEPNDQVAIAIQEREYPPLPAEETIDQGYIDNSVKFDDIPYADEEEYIVPVFEAPRVLPNMQMSDHAPLAFPEQYSEEQYAPLPIEETIDQGYIGNSVRFDDIPYVDEEENFVPVFEAPMFCLTCK